MNLRTKASVFTVLLLVTATSSKTLDTPSFSPLEKDSWGPSGVVSFLRDLADSAEHEKDWIGTLVLPKVLQKLKENGGGISEVLGVSEDFMTPLIRLADEAQKLRGKESLKRDKIEASQDAITNSIEGGAGKEDLTSKFLSLAKTVFLEEYGGLDSLLKESGAHSLDLPALPSLNLTSINLWEVVRSTWARVLSYVEEQNSLESFMQRTPVRIIDRVLNLGDDLNLASFLANKLDPEFAEFVAAKAEVVVAPLRDAHSLANLTQAAGLTKAVDYFTSPRVRHTVYTLAGLVSAYLEDRLNSDLARQFLDFMSLDNVELTHFYHSLVSGSQQQPGEGRVRRDVMDHIVSAFEYDDQQQDDPIQERSLRPADQLAQENDPSGHVHDVKEIVPRDGGYGSGYGGGYGGGYGYGYMSTLDPYVVLGALALGTLLGFLLFRLINGTRRGRRDIGDGSLSLWQSDLPFFDSNRALRAERAAPAGREGLSLPASLRGDVWSSAPLVDNETSTGLSLMEDDLADHLNQLWRAHRGNDSTTCVRGSLCGQLVGGGATHAGLALLLSSTAGLLGVAGSGQLLDEVTGSQSEGTTYSCPAGACSFPL